MADPQQPPRGTGALGIDLGATNSVVSYVDAAGRAVVTRNSDGECTTPSVVYFESQDRVVVGHMAKDVELLHPDLVVSLIKRELGNREYRRTFFGVEFTPPSISAIILKALADSAEVDTGRRVTDVVIAVPAYFGVLERDAIVQASQIAGLNVIRIVPEPVAAALHYGVTGGAGGTTFLVYDLGGGTFDVSLIRMTDEAAEILMVDGDHRLGGVDWDKRLMDYIVDQIITQGRDDPPYGNAAILQNLVTLAEKIKKDLSAMEAVTIGYTDGAAEITITRAQFEEMTADLLAETIRITRRALAEAKERYLGIEQQISEILLVGGSCRMPAVREALRRELGWDLRLADPELAVAKGAALYAAKQVVRSPSPYARDDDQAADTSRSGFTSPAANAPVSDDAVRALADELGISMQDVEQMALRGVRAVASRSLGIKVVDASRLDWSEHGEDAAYIEHVLHASDSLPATHRFSFATVESGQQSIEIAIYEQAGAQESPRMEDNRVVSQGVISGIPPLPAGSPIEITMNLDDQGLLSVTAVEPHSGKKLDMEVRLSPLEEEQIAEAKRVVAGLTLPGATPVSDPRSDLARLPPPPPAGSLVAERETSASGESRQDSLVADEMPPPARYLAADLPERAPAGARVSLLVRIVLASSSAPSVSLKAFAVPSAGAKVTISVSAQGLVALGDLEQEVLVPAHADSEPVRFGFRTGAVGLHTVTVRAFAGGTFLGELTVQMSVELGAALEEGHTRTADIGPTVAEPGEVTLQVNREGDLYSFQLISETWYPAQLSGRLAGDPSEAVEALVAELRGMAAGQPSYASPKLVRARLRNLGAQLWADAVPAAIRRQFWEQADRITSFAVASDLDNIPWELLYPVDGDNELGFLCEQVPLVRRVYSQGRTRTLPLSSVAYVVPRGSPDDAMEEVARVRARLGRDINDQGVLESLQDLTALLDDARTGLLHFAGHNKFTSADGSVIIMSDGPFRPSDLSVAVQRKALAESGPLIFFNGCRSAGDIPGFTRMMGWARQFMGAGAGAFLGSLWPVRSSSARDFADAFYAAFVAGQQPLGEATRTARKAIAEEMGDPTWLAYTVYGNPAATAAGK